ncbi:MAG: alkyl sulfatase dimerization domain-containing protein [Dehalococcoidia bacterium]|nr:alkyl sulfatase dimerization domain-containing protein [Dehalococcoidia bacterium]
MTQHYEDSYLELTRREVNEIFMKDEDCTPDIIRVAPGWPIAGSSGVIITDEGVVVVDTGIAGDAPGRVQKIRQRTQVPFHSLIYTHGHLDHAGGAQVFIEDALKRGHPRPGVIGHENVAPRFDKYQRLAGRRAYISRLQFPRRPGAGASSQTPVPMTYVYPDVVVKDAMKFRIGGLTLEIYSAFAETDDCLWVWIPERRVAIIGDLLIGGCPNTGNPLKEQRYTLEWAQTLEIIAGKNPEYVIAGAGPIIRGNLIDVVLLDTAKYLRTIHDQVIDLLNKEFWIEDIIKRVKIPEDLAKKPWLAPTYGHPVFIIHDVYRRYTGWYDGNPSGLFPADSAGIGAEVTDLSGGAGNIMKRAEQLKEQGQSQLALHLIDFAIKGAKDTATRKEALLLKSEILNARADIEPSLIARNILRTGAVTAKDTAEKL